MRQRGSEKRSVATLPRLTMVSSATAELGANLEADPM
jgi:hypothetical protein